MREIYLKQYIQIFGKPAYRFTPTRYVFRFLLSNNVRLELTTNQKGNLIRIEFIDKLTRQEIPAQDVLEKVLPYDAQKMLFNLDLMPPIQEATRIIIPAPYQLKDLVLGAWEEGW